MELLAGQRRQRHGAVLAKVALGLRELRRQHPQQVDARRRIQAAHVLVHPSVIEGGAHVVMEAVCSGTPVLASRIAGNIGMLGEDYGGYFELGDSEALAALLQRCRDEPAMLDRLAAQCASRAPLFEPALEQATLLALLHAMIGSKTSGKNAGPYR